MATTAGTLRSDTPISKRITITGVALLGIFVVSILFLIFNYWLAVIFFFSSLLILIRFGLDEDEARGLWLLLIFSLFVTVFMGSLALLFLSNNPSISELAQNNSIAGIFLGSNLAIVLTSFLIGLAAALASVIIPLLLVVAIAAVSILKWHRKDPSISFWTTYKYMLASVFGIFYPWVIVENSEIKGAEKDKARLAYFGGPGWLTVHPGQVVVLHRWGKITRVVGLGSTILRREEQIKAVVPLAGKGGTNTIENVLTRDRIPLKITVAHAVQVEPAQEMRLRLQQAVNDAEKQLQEATNTNKPQQEIQEAQKQLEEAKVRQRATKDNQGNDIINDIGDDYDKCYEPIARLVASKVSLKDNTYVVNIWESMKGSIINNIKDVIMSCDFDELFSAGGDNKDLGVCLNNRKIEEIEKTVRDRVKESGIDKGLSLRVVDINEVNFPEGIKDKITEQVTAYLDARIKQDEAKTRELTAQYEAKARGIEAQAKEIASRYEANARLQLARAEAQIEVLRAKARAEYYKQIVQMLRGQNQPEDTIKTVLQNLAASSSTIHYIHREQTINASSESSKDQAQDFEMQRFY